jgi:hypothetical protein
MTTLKDNQKDSHMAFKDNLATDPRFCATHKKAKNGQDYIPWAILLAEARLRHPDLRVAYGPIVSHPGMVGLIVEAEARIGDGHSWTAQLAVTDMRNKVIEKPTADAVQNAQQRALAKAVSMATGIGLSLWFGDIQAPTGEVPEAPASKEQIDRIGQALDAGGYTGVSRSTAVSTAVARSVTRDRPLTASEADRVLATLSGGAVRAERGAA